MTPWKPETLVRGGGALYAAIADALADDIRRGRLVPGSRLPTHRQLARDLGVNVVTVTRAYAEAARRGLVDGEVGRGTFVRKYDEGSFLRQHAHAATRVDFHFNDPAGDPGELSHEHLQRLLAGADVARLLRTGYVVEGLAAHRAAGAAWLGRAGLRADPARVLVTSGAQHAMTVALSATVQPGDALAAEELTYPGLKAVAHALHLRVVGVPMDREGVLPDALEELCRKGGLKVFYVTPTLQNPTGTVLSAERRAAIAEVARRRGLVLIEDDTTGPLRPDPPPALATYAPERTLFLSSVSKGLCSGLRIGFLYLPREAEGQALSLERLTANLAATTWMAPPLMAEIASRCIVDGTAERLIAWKRAETRARRELLHAAIGAARSASDASSSFVWLELPMPWRSADFVAQADRRGVAVSPGETFVVGRVDPPRAVRVALGTPRHRESVSEGLAVLAELLAGTPSAFRSIC